MDIMDFFWKKLGGGEQRESPREKSSRDCGQDGQICPDWNCNWQVLFVLAYFFLGNPEKRPGGSHVMIALVQPRLL